MTIYLDLLFILNFLYDTLLLFTVSVTLKRNAKVPRILLASFFGALSTLLILLPFNKYLLLLLKIIAGIIMLIIAFRYQNFKYTMHNFLYLYMSSVILAGFLYFLKIEFKNLSYLLSFSIAPVILYLYN